MSDESVKEKANFVCPHALFLQTWSQILSIIGKFLSSVAYIIA